MTTILGIVIGWSLASFFAGFTIGRILGSVADREVDE